MKFRASSLVQNKNSNDDEKNDFHDGWLVTPMKSLEVTNNNPQR